MMRQCPHGFRHSKRGLVYNRAHRCNRSCQWEVEQCIEWANATPYPTQQQPPVQVEHVPCSCGRPYSEHVQTVSRNGYVTGIKEVPCDQAGWVAWPIRHLLTCDCLECVTTRITRDRRERIESVA